MGKPAESPEAVASRTEPVGVVGLGQMGGAMASNLLRRGFTVYGLDVGPTRAVGLAPEGLLAVTSIHDATAADIIITSLPSEAALEEVTRELVGANRPDRVIIETSTLSIGAKQRAASVLLTAGVTLLDCPLSGTGHQAISGDLVVFASGEASAVERCAAVFEGFSRAHYQLGPVGAGTRMKLIANHLVAIHNVAAAEALVLARTSGLDPDLALAVLSDSAGTSRMLEVRGPTMLSGDYSSGVSNRVFQKDLSLIRSFAAEHGTPTPLFALSAELHAAACAQGFADLDTASVYEVLSALAGGADRDTPDDGQS